MIRRSYNILWAARGQTVCVCVHVYVCIFLYVCMFVGCVVVNGTIWHVMVMATRMWVKGDYILQVHCPRPSQFLFNLTAKLAHRQKPQHKLIYIHIYTIYRNQRIDNTECYFSDGKLINMSLNANNCITKTKFIMTYRFFLFTKNWYIQ